MSQFADSFSVESLGKVSSEDTKQIMNGNLCELLFTSKENMMNCEKLLNGAFLKGVGNVLVELVKNIKSRTSSMHNLTNKFVI